MLHKAEATASDSIRHLNNINKRNDKKMRRKCRVYWGLNHCQSYCCCLYSELVDPIVGVWIKRKPCFIMQRNDKRIWIWTDPIFALVPYRRCTGQAIWTNIKSFIWFQIQTSLFLSVSCFSVIWIWSSFYSSIMYVITTITFFPLIKLLSNS